MALFLKGIHILPNDIPPDILGLGLGDVIRAGIAGLGPGCDQQAQGKQYVACEGIQGLDPCVS